MKKISIAAFVVLAMGAAAIGANALISDSPSERVAQTPAALQMASFSVENMTCATCPITVQRAMEGIAGVDDVTIDYAAKTAVARFDPAQTTAGAIAAASTDAGYPAERND